jgi:transketolase
MPSQAEATTETSQAIAAQLRAKVVEMSHQAKCPHLGSALSCIDILTVVYRDILKIDPAQADDFGRDRFILSKGHAAPALYATLNYFGFFSDEVMARFNQDGAELAEQPAPFCVPGLEAATGSLGHGLPIGLGIALAGRIQNTDYRVIVCLSDGECNEGSVWEAAMTAPAFKLSNVTAIVDYNKWQATGRSDEILQLPSLADKWKAFGWHTLEIDGHDHDQLRDALSTTQPDQPVAIIAHTTKGKGVSFMEDDNNWHYRIPTAEEVDQAREDLGVSHD